MMVEYHSHLSPDCQRARLGVRVVGIRPQLLRHRRDRVQSRPSVIAGQRGVQDAQPVRVQFQRPECRERFRAGRRRRVPWRGLNPHARQQGVVPADLVRHLVPQDESESVLRRSQTFQQAEGNHHDPLAVNLRDELRRREHIQRKGRRVRRRCGAGDLAEHLAGSDDRGMVVRQRPVVRALKLERALGLAESGGSVCKRVTHRQNDQMGQNAAHV